MPSTYNYSYPNVASYSMLPARPGVGLYNGRLLRHGYIYGYKPPTVTSSSDIENSSDAASAVANAAAGLRRIDWQNSMVFQFNPADLPMTVQMMAADSPDAEIPGGNAGVATPGLASSRLQLFFDRTNEISRATMNKAGQHGQTKYRDLGVQCDLFDLFKVISGGDESALAEYEDPGDIGSPFPGAVLPGSTNHLSGKLFDAVRTGSSVFFRSFALVFNANLSVHVQKMSSLSFSYIRFTADLVPTTVQVDMNLEIMNMGTKAYTTSGGQGGPVSPVPPSQTPPPGTRTPINIDPHQF